MSTSDLAVIGAGAAGLTLATCVRAGGRQVAVIDNGARPGDGWPPASSVTPGFDTDAVRRRIEDDAALGG